jgi:hypothetical protein
MIDFVDEAIAIFLDMQGWKGKEEWHLKHPYQESAS